MLKKIINGLLLLMTCYECYGQQSKRPNIVLIMTDQQTATAMSNAGNMDLHTPAMDKLAANGVRFTRAYCAQPLCTPSRTAIFSGKMPFETGFTGNAEEKDGQWPDSVLMMGRILHNGGYQTGYVGKWHLPVPAGNVSQHGFEYVKNTNFGDYNDAATPSFCANFIRLNKDQPFLLVASFLNPHDICEWARGDLLKMDILGEAPDTLLCPPLPGNWEIPANEPAVVREQQKVSFRTYPTVNWNDAQWRKYRWAYNRLVEKVDNYIGMVLASLQKYGVADNTIIIFTSDHGDGYAAHKWNQKQVLYEEAAKVPFIISRLHQWKPRTDDLLVCNGTDMIPTICGLTGVAAPSYLKGVDLSKRIVDSTRTLRETLVIETDFADNDVLLGISGRAVMSGHYKYIMYSKGEIKEQLFDLSKDPGEMNNLAMQSSNKRILGAMRSYLKKWCKQNNDKFLEYL
ncbi:sulfatase family protein [Chitinophaga sp. RAB17]|uniref:sulfatase family protein n=1 Tax=Chitinophaga sp. RAB17 TaxID=3233049 RepID=UPI003F92D130